MSRSSLTNWAGRAVDPLEPVSAAQAAHILEGGVVAMDETSIKAGRVAPGKMRTAYFWPVYGEADEIVFHHAPSRAHKHAIHLPRRCSAAGRPTSGEARRGTEAADLEDTVPVSAVTFRPRSNSRSANPLSAESPKRPRMAGYGEDASKKTTVHTG